MFSSLNNDSDNEDCMPPPKAPSIELSTNKDPREEEKEVGERRRPRKYENRSIQEEKDVEGSYFEDIFVLPDEMFWVIFTFLTLEEICVMNATTPRFNIIFENIYFWNEVLDSRDSQIREFEEKMKSREVAEMKKQGYGYGSASTYDVENLNYLKAKRMIKSYRWAKQLKSWRTAAKILGILEKFKTDKSL